MIELNHTGGSNGNGSNGNGSNGNGSNGHKRATHSLIVLGVHQGTDEMSALDAFLDGDGCLILHAQNQNEALAKTRRFHPDLILIDCDVPDISAPALLSILLTEVPAALVILVAKNPKPAEVVEAMRLGAGDYLSKSIDFQKLKYSVDLQRELLLHIGNASND